MAFKVIDESDIEDFRAVIVEAGYAPEDFDISERADPLPPLGIGKETGVAIVTYKKTGVVRRYAVGHGTTWPNAFKQDLEAGVFASAR